MIKKTIQSFAFFAILQLFIFSCCTEDYDIYYDTLYFIAEDELDNDTTTVKSEDLILHFDPIYEYIVASNFIELQRFSETAYATSCDENYTLKETVSNIKITANQDILGVSAGDSLNQKLSYINPYTLENEAVENSLETLNNGYGSNYERKKFVFNETITEGISLQFTIQITIVQNNRILEATTEQVTIE